MTKKITIPYFPAGLKYATPLLSGAAVYLIVIDHFIWAVLLILLSGAIITTNYVTEIDLGRKTCRDYLSLFGLCLNEEVKKFNNIDRIIILKGNYAQTINTRAQSRQLNWSDYTGILVLDNDDTLDLLTRNSKKELIAGLKEFAEFLNVGVEDRTTPQHYWVDMNKVTG